MSLPVKFRNVHYYRISGRYTFAGDLFVTRGAIYFFPEVDLAEQRRKSTEYLPHSLAVVVFGLMYLLQRVNSYAPRSDFWEAGMSNEQFQLKADAYIETLKAARMSRGFSELPLPTRVRIGEFSDLKLGLLGRMSFLAQSDNHDFSIGPRRKKRLREALWEGGFSRV